MTGDTWVVCPVTALLLIGFVKISFVITGAEVGVLVFFAIWKREGKIQKSLHLLRAEIILFFIITIELFPTLLFFFPSDDQW